MPSIAATVALASAASCIAGTIAAGGSGTKHKYESRLLGVFLHVVSWDCTSRTCRARRACGRRILSSLPSPVLRALNLPGNSSWPNPSNATAALSAVATLGSTTIQPCGTPSKKPEPPVLSFSTRKLSLSLHDVQKELAGKTRTKLWKSSKR